MRLPGTLDLGASTLQLGNQETATGFLQGFQTGHLTYRIKIQKLLSVDQPITDTDLLCIFLRPGLNILPSHFLTGFLLGIIATIFKQAAPPFSFAVTEEAFDEGLDDGAIACYHRGRWGRQQIISLEELTAIVSQCRQRNTLWSAGYLVGFLNALTVPADTWKERITFEAEGIPA
jgi:hypothetical protein